MRIDVPKEFANCVRLMGGVVPDDTPSPAKPKNADFWFEKEGVLAELKCLREDLLTKPKTQERLTKLHASWVQRGLMPPSPRTRIRLNLKDIPETCALEFLRPIKRRLESEVFGEANRQIKASKISLSASTAKGLLLLVNDGDYTLTPEMLSYLIMQTLTTNSSINSVVYFSVNEAIFIPGLVTPAPFWIEMPIPGRARVERAFCEAIRSAWMAHCSGLGSEPIAEVVIRSTPAIVREIQFHKRTR